MNNTVNERAFWESFARTSNPDWDVQLAPEFTPGSTVLQAHDVFVYVLNTRTGFLAGASTTQHQLISAYDQISTFPEATKSQAQDTAGRLISREEEVPADKKAAHSMACIKASIAAIVLTKTYKMVLDQGSLDGHWIYITYQTPKEVIARPVFFRVSQSGFAPRADLEKIIRQVVTRDTTDPSTVVYGQIADAGGLLGPSEKPS